MNNNKLFIKIKESKIVKILLIAIIILTLYFVVLFIYKIYIIREEYKQQLIYKERYDDFYKNKIYLKEIFSNKEKTDEYLKTMLTGTSDRENVILIYNTSTNTLQEITNKDDWLSLFAKKVDYVVKNYTKFYENK